MSAANSNLTYDYAATSYASNVAAAARGLLAALFAVKPRPAALALDVADADISQRSKQASSSWLNSLAQECELYSPNLSAELRFMASRG